MIQILVEIPKSMQHGFEDRFMEMVIPSWTICEDRIRHRLDLIGYFDSPEEGLKSYTSIRARFPELAEHPAISPVADRDWKEAYKEHFQPWCAGGLHWVPAWLKEKYPLPEGAKAIYLDPGMAFGTGNHETTRLCAVRLIEAAREWGDSIGKRTVIDAGCGSGILAISAAKIGFGSVSGFDIDLAAVQISNENATFNGLGGKIPFNVGGLEKCLPGKQADLVLANILANVLTQYADILLGSVLPGGWLVLSGILATEVGGVKNVFEARSKVQWGSSEIKSRIDGEWADIVLVRPLR
jgi:ribosomal protein L11 methyltransferase